MCLADSKQPLILWLNLTCFLKGNFSVIGPEEHKDQDKAEKCGQARPVADGSDTLLIGYVQLMRIMTIRGGSQQGEFPTSIR